MTHFEDILGRTPGSEAELRRLITLEEKWGADGCKHIFEEAMQHNVRTLAYVEGISARLERESKSPATLGEAKPNGRTPPGKPSLDTPTPDPEWVQKTKAAILRAHQEQENDDA